MQKGRWSGSAAVRVAEDRLTLPCCGPGHMSDSREREAFRYMTGPQCFVVRRQNRMSNTTWACFDCREGVRRPTHHPKAVPCPQCGQDCVCLGTKIHIPSKRDDRAWQALRILIREARHAALERVERMRVEHRHRLERLIAVVESRPGNDGREGTLRRLRSKLASL